jgi:hypothetical protein
MKLLLYTHFFPPSVGGTETIVVALGGVSPGRAAFLTEVFNHFEETSKTPKPVYTHRKGNFPRVLAIV